MGAAKPRPEGPQDPARCGGPAQRPGDPVLKRSTGAALRRVLADRGTEDCGTHDRHEDELYLAVEDIDHTRTKAKRPQTNGIVARFDKTMLDEFCRIAFRKTIYATIEDLQTDLDLWMRELNEARPDQGKRRFAKTPLLRRSRPSLTRSRSRAKNPFRSQTAIDPPPHDQTGRPTPSVRSNTNFSSSDNLPMSHRRGLP